MNIIYPSGRVGFVEYKRAFCVQGSFARKIDFENPCLKITLSDRDGNCVRKLSRQGMYGEMSLYDERLTAYPEQRDPGREKLRRFGFPELMLDENGSLYNAESKLWFSETFFKGIIISATDVAHGAISDDGMGMTNADGEPYSLLPMGEYTLTVTLFSGENAVETAKKQITVAKRENQLICRFNPTSHKERIVRWSRECGFSAITDPLPGYLDSYLGDWDYHKGLLKMYRANDLPLFESAKVRMFVYLTDEKSTSLETELAYLQTVGVVGRPDRFFAYHYDIGEALVGKGRKYARRGIPTEFAPGEYMAFCRADIVSDKASDGVYYIDERNVIRSEFFSENSEISVNFGEKFAIHGVIKPWQGKKSDCTLRDDNTYEVNNYPYIIQYTVKGENGESVFEKKAGMERFEEKSIGNSVFEFYNIFDSKTWNEGDLLRFSVVCIDKNGNKSDAFGDFSVKVTKNSKK